MVTAEQLTAFAAATNNELFDSNLQKDGTPYGWMVEAVETQETIENFVEASNSYNECTREKFGEIAGFKFVAFAKIQPFKGDTRRALSVIDFGTVRVAIDADLTYFLTPAPLRFPPRARGALNPLV